MKKITIKLKEGYVTYWGGSGHCVMCSHVWEEGEEYIPVKDKLNGLCLACVENYEENDF